MKITIIGQIQNKKTGLGKAINDFINFCSKNATKTTTIDITNNKRFFEHCYHILVSDTEVFYFTPSGSVGGNVRDSFYLFLMILKGKKIVTHFHNSAFGNVVNKNRLLQLMNKWIYRHIDKIILLGYKSKQMFDILMIPDTKFKVIRNGVDEDLFISEDNFKKKQDNKTINVIYFSNMIKEKGYEIVFEVAKKLQDNQRFHFYFSGKFFDKQLEEKFKNEISGMENITYYNGVYGQEKKQLLQNMHYFVLPSSYKDETLPISMLEAMASGVYIIATDVGVISEVINEIPSEILKSSNNMLSSEIQNVILLTNENINFSDFKMNKMKSEFSNNRIQKNIFEVLENVTNNL